ncbi:hypothetical protein, conserved [Leishmania donovani]|uniref:CAF1 ribonuclease family protein n=1 Tax=Leishmania donovani TaxID=5661 RepID=E9BV19_LEIDO|nr:hypothetical protein, conserved [Leishmania donovani]TPP48773.1 CAF1 ribonuclease family protein [Leishmania donovani]CBZ39098.1 hypothetical protein, conserved [Leishmania donovani]
MDITRFNQLVALPDFAREVERCEFCAIDQEMTGVDVTGVSAPFGAPPEAVYHAKRAAVVVYNAFQMGIALFTKTENNTYEVRPYNFYLLNDSGDLRLNLSVVSFLAANHLNFQTWLTSGLPFCNEQEEAAYEEKLQMPFTDHAEQQIADALIEAIDEWMPAGNEPLVRELPCVIDLARRLQSFLYRRYDSRIAVNYDGKPYLGQKIKFTLTKLDTNEWISEKEKRRLQCERDRGQQLGFRLFWKILVQSRKPIVGHNFMQDVMFMIHMHETPISQDYLEFKKVLQRTLPSIYDTKTMATKLTGDDAFPVTHLEPLYQECRRRAGFSSDQFTQEYRLPPGFYGYNDSAVKLQSKAHEAAYDAYMTGIAFSLMHKLYPGAFMEMKNVISAFGSAYFFCVDTDDQLVNPSTFILKCAVPCHSEEIEALFFATEDITTQATENGKVDMKKLSYQVNGLAISEGAKNYSSFCVRMKQAMGIDDLHRRLQSLRDKELSPSTNVNPLLLDLITLHNA